MIGYAYNPKNGQPLRSVPVYCFRADTRAAHTTASTTTDSVGKYAFTDLDPTLPYVFEVRYGTTVMTHSRPVVPMCHVRNDANIVVSNATVTALTFNTERFDTDSMHSTSSNTSRITVATAGEYDFDGGIEWDSNVNGFRQIGLRLNGATIVKWDSDNAVSGNTHPQAIHARWKMVVGDYMELVVYQNSGGNLNVNVTSAYSPEFSAVLVSGG
jgi:hypothetical protein